MKIATRAEKTKQRAFLKDHFKQLPKDVMDVYVMKVRERLAYHGFVKEAIIDTLNDNNEQAFRQLDKVKRCLTYKTIIFVTHISFCLLCSMLTDGAHTRPLSVGLKTTSLMRLTAKTSSLVLLKATD